MLYAVESTNVVRSNLGEETEFRIANNAKMFRVLSDTLYQNKIGSLVREICCNAYDSHVEAGHPDMPFVVHIPDQYEPWFSVKDFGIGLDDEGVRTVFATYGVSTKGNNNSLIGTFGLGSKTPFAYTDAFTIIAVKNGIRRVYGAFINEHGLPAVALMDESPTQAMNGVEIQVPVTNTADIGTFVREVSEQLTFFKVKPVIENYPEGIIYRNVEFDDSSSFNVHDIKIGSANSGLFGVWAVQGVVGYPVDVDLVARNVSDDCARFLRAIEGHSAVIEFDLGTLEVTASREGISYTQRTFDSFEAKLLAARNALTRSLQTKLAGITSPWLRARFLMENSNLLEIAGHTDIDFGSKYYAKTGAGIYIDLEAISAVQEQLEDGTVANVKKYSFNLHVQEYTRRVTKYVDRGNVKGVPVDNQLVFIFKDATDRPVVRLRGLFHSWLNENKRYVTIGRIDGKPLSESDQQELVARFGEGFEAIKLSELPVPDMDRVSRAGYKVPLCYSYEKGDDTRTTREWEREFGSFDDFENGAVYLRVKNHRIQHSGDSIHIFDIHAAGLVDRPIVAIRERDEEKIANNDKWISASAFVEKMKVSLPTGTKTLENCHFVMDCVLGNDYLPGSFAGRWYWDGCKEFYRILDENADAIKDPMSPIRKLVRIRRVKQKLIARYKRKLQDEKFGNLYKLFTLLFGSTQRSHNSDRCETLNKAIDKYLFEHYPELEFVDFAKALSYRSIEKSTPVMIGLINKLDTVRKMEQQAGV